MQAAAAAAVIIAHYKTLAKLNGKIVCGLVGKTFVCQDREYREDRHSIMIQIVQSACIINAAAAAANRCRPLKTIVDSSNFDDHK